MLVLRNVEVAGRPGLDVRIDHGRIAEIGAGLTGGESLDGRGGALICGLVDHHIHLMALAAQAGSVDLRGHANVAAALAAAASLRPPGAWLRATGYHEAMAGDLDRQVLDRLVPDHPLRVQHQTGSLWILNSAALQRLGDGPALERDAAGRPTGRLWRGDAWLRTRLDGDPPDLAAVGRTLAGFGITALTDASVSTDAAAAALLTAARLPQRLTLMSHAPLAAPDDGAFAVGPLKILLDDHALPDFDAMTADIARARREARPVAVHCVTAAELALTLAAFEAEGARPGDRIEHGGVIPQSAIPVLVALGLTVVTQPAFVHERGDRYLAEVDAAEQADLYRCASLLASGVPMAASSDAPYASPDPWAGIAAAVRRRTRAGQALGAGEAVDAARALGLYLADPAAPGGPPRRVVPGAAADLCLLAAPLAAVLAEPHAAQVRLTLVAGQIVHGAG